MAKSKKVFRSPKLARRQARKRRSTVAERRKKEFLWRGYSMDELKSMPLYPPEEDPEALSIVALLPSRARRSYARGLSEECEKLLEKFDNTSGVVRTHCRGMYIVPSMVGRTVGIHNGREFVKVDIQPEMIGHAMGNKKLSAQKPAKKDKKFFGFKLRAQSIIT